MNAVTQSDLIDPSGGDSAEPLRPEIVARARLYHFFELALAHPAEDGLAYFRLSSTEADFRRELAALAAPDPELVAGATEAAGRFFAAMRALADDAAEAAHIAMFSANYPHLPCPPYGSLFTAPDADKRLAEMLAIKSFYQRNGVDISDSYTDLPDHVCVELEFSQLLCFRENLAAADPDQRVLDGLRAAQAEFLDRYLLPLGKRLAELAAGALPESPYRHLLDSLGDFLTLHRNELAVSVAISNETQENQP